jgi:hypothetical protein
VKAAKIGFLEGFILYIYYLYSFSRIFKGGGVTGVCYKFKIQDEFYYFWLGFLPRETSVLARLRWLEFLPRERERERELEMGKGKGKVVERKKEKKKRGRPSLSDVRKRTLKEEQKRNHNFSPHSASNYPIVTVPVPASGLAPLRRSARLNPYRYADESDADEICSEESESDESADERYSMRAIGRMTDEDRVRYREQVYRTDVSEINSLRLCIYVRIYLCLQL